MPVHAPFSDLILTGRGSAADTPWASWSASWSPWVPMQDTRPVAPPRLPAKLIDVPTLVETDGIGNPKLFTLNEHESDTGDPLEVLIDGQQFHSPITEQPRVGTTEAWYFQNLTEDAHPVRLGRQPGTRLHEATAAPSGAAHHKE